MARKQVKSVSGQVVAITGGAQGIGKSTAAALVRRGARVAIGDLNRELAEKTATELGGNCVAFELDVTSRPSFEAFLDAAEAELGPVDVVINNAGIMPLNMLSDEPDEIAKLQIDINLHGVIFGTKIAIARMVPRAKGHIVNIASQAGKAGFPGGATYCATKHAVVGLSEAARLELRDTGVEVSVVMPAVVNTEARIRLARGARGQDPRARRGRRGGRRGDRDEPLRRLGAEEHGGDRDGDEHRPAAWPRGDRPPAEGRRHSLQLRTRAPVPPTRIAPPAASRTRQPQRPPSLRRLRRRANRACS